MNGEIDFDKTSYKAILSRGVKKMTVELTSVKFLLLIFLGYVTVKYLVKESTLLGIGVGAMLLLVGIKEGAESIKSYIGTLGQGGSTGEDWNKVNKAG